MIIVLMRRYMSCLYATVVIVLSGLCCAGQMDG